MKADCGKLWYPSWASILSAHLAVLTLEPDSGLCLTTSPHQMTLITTVHIPALKWGEKKEIASSVHRTQTSYLLDKCTNIHFLIKEWFYFKMKDTAWRCLSTQEVETENSTQSQALILTDFKTSVSPVTPYLKEIYLKENHIDISRKYH